MIETQTEKTPSRIDVSELAVYIKDIRFIKRTGELLQETADDLMAVYFSDEYDLEHRAMVYDNFVHTIHSFLAHSQDQEPQSGDKFESVAEMIAKTEKIAYQKRHWPDGSPVSEPLAITGELDKVIGSVATADSQVTKVEVAAQNDQVDVQRSIAQMALSEVTLLT